MIQVLRLMGMPDKMIAFDELPSDLLEGLEMHDESKMPRHWRDFFGIRTKRIDIKPYFDPFTKQRVICEPLMQTGPFSWLIDWEINNNKERWQEISNHVRRNTPKEFRLMDKIEDMAKPLAANPQDAASLEPEEVIIIPLMKSTEEKEPESAQVQIAPAIPETQTASAPTMTVAVIKQDPIQVAATPEIVEIKAVSAPNTGVPQAKNAPCEVCGKKFSDGRGRYSHMKAHQIKQPVAA